MILWAPVNGYDMSSLAYLLHSALVPEELRRQRAQWQAFLQQIGSEELRDHLAELAGRNTGWSLRLLAPTIVSARQGREGEEQQPLACRSMVRRLDQRWRLGSFSHLIAQGTPSPEEREPEPELSWVVEAPAEQGEGVALARFPKGPVAGNFFHRIFELLRFGREDDDPSCQLAELVGEQLVRHGYDREQWRDLLCQALARVLRTPLLARDPFCLQDLADEECLREMGFVFPLARAAEPEAILSPSLLARPFREYPASIPAGYAESLAALPFAPLRGFLKGFMDLVFARQGKWYILDYKSNHLGNGRADYASDRLVPAMAEHHYYLQYHIYAVALHRHLAARLPDYRYESHFGGVFYLFIKGMHPDSGPAAGVFHDLPPVERIEMLSELFAQGGLP
jgi:exodeoxyribonuclease V beta subunit